MRRRHLLRTGVAALLASIAGCAGGEGTDTPGSTPTDTPDETPTATATASPSASLAPDDTPATTPTATAGDTPTDTATPAGGGSPTATPTASATSTATRAPDGARVVRVAPEGEFRFAPETFEIATGDTVRWTWERSGHNVRADSTPPGADWQGTPGGDGTTYDEGHTYEHTFEVAGEYEYVCIPHESFGMTGSFTVAE